MSTQEFHLSRDTLAGRRVLVDRISQDSISLARALRRLGAQVGMVDPDPVPEALLLDCRQLEQEGITLQSAVELNGRRLEYDILFADLLTGPAAEPVSEALQSGKPVTNLSDFLLQFCPIPVIGITGSAGKSTTTALTAAMLEAAGCSPYFTRANFVSNMWPNADLIDRLGEMKLPGWLVVEITNAHLEYMHVSPEIAVVTNLAPDHVEWHGSLEAYYAAKEKIFKFQSGDQWAILNHDDLTRTLFAGRCPGHTAFHSLVTAVDPGVFIRDGQIVAHWNDREEVIAPVSAVRLQRQHLPNVLAAGAAALAAGANAAGIAQAIHTFTGLQMRMELVGEIGGVRFYNDRAITPKKTASSLQSFPNQPIVWLAGGTSVTPFRQEVHGSEEELEMIRAICQLARDKTRAVILFGEVAPQLQEYLEAAAYPASSIHRAGSVAEAVQAALDLASAGEVVLLAPLYFIMPEEAQQFTLRIQELAGPHPADGRSSAS